MEFCDELQQASKYYWEASFTHPFVTGIADGTLALEKYKMYMLQDAYYLKQYTKVLALAAAKAENSEEAGYFLESAHYVAEAELSLHKTALQQFGIEAGQLEQVQPAPAAYNYCSHLLQVAYQGDSSEIFAAIFPCPWLYQAIGERYRHAKPSVKLYQDWIEMYSSEQLEHKVAMQKMMMNAYAERQPHKRELYKEHFVKSCYYEWQFWQMAWTLEAWEPAKEEVLEL